MQIAGVHGELRWGYHCAARVRRYTAVRGEQGWSLTATIAEANSVWLSQRPLMFEAPHAKGAWSWPVLELQIAGASLIATLGPRSGPDGNPIRAAGDPQAASVG